MLSESCYYPIDRKGKRQHYSCHFPITHYILSIEVPVIIEEGVKDLFNHVPFLVILNWY